MKTKDFIKLLQESDPSGDATVVVGTYPVVDAEVEPGYYDGHFWKALDKNGQECIEEYPSKMVLTGNGSKLKIFYIEPDSLLWDHVTAKGIKIEDYIGFDSAYSRESDREEQKKRWLDELNETYNQAHEFRVKSDEEWIPKTKKLFENNCYVQQVKSGTDKFWMTYHIDGNKRESMMQGYIMCLRNYPEFFSYKENAEGTERIWELKK